MRLEVHKLCAFYGRAQILFDISLKLERGEVLALLGRNGAGKSTTLKSIVGLVEQRSGRVVLDGRDITDAPTAHIARAGLGYVPEDRRIFTELTVAENLLVGRQPPRPGAPAWTEKSLFHLFPNLAELSDRPAGEISGGEQQMLTIARTLMGNPAALMLDEPSEGLAPLIVEQLGKAILTLKQQGLSILLSEQNLHLARAIGDRVSIIEKGRIRFEGTMAEFANDQTISRTFLAV
ncbi:MAG: ABC transporter ATP-binding protein [Rhodospirillales bacterium]|nr:ABC transporter ATP-binding protein [Rhodospirillales bacterium]